MKVIILSLLILVSCASKKEATHCIALAGFEKKPLSEYGLVGSNSFVLQGPKDLIYIVIEGVVIPTVACYPAGVLDHPASEATPFSGLSSIYRNCFEKLQRNISSCPNVSKEADELGKVVQCYESVGQIEKAREQRALLTDENAFSGCLYSKAIEERK